MAIFKTNPFGHYDFIKKWLIRVAGVMSHRRYRGFNALQIEGSEIIKDLPETNVLLYPIIRPILQMWLLCFTYLMPA